MDIYKYKFVNYAPSGADISMVLYLDLTQAREVDSKLKEYIATPGKQVLSIVDIFNVMYLLPVQYAPVINNKVTGSALKQVLEQLKQHKLNEAAETKEGNVIPFPIKKELND